MADRQAHAVSDADLAATRRLLAATPGLVGEPSDAGGAPRGGPAPPPPAGAGAPGGRGFPRR